MPNKRPLPAILSSQNVDHHEPHDFIPSPQFHHTGESSAGVGIRPGDVDYDFEGIQTEPKPGQYVIFSKPQLNPELKENQLKKKPELNNIKEIVSNVPHYQDKGTRFPQEPQKHVIFNPKEGQFYQNGPVLKAPVFSNKQELGRPIYGTLPDKPDDELPLELVPPKDTQTEKTFEGNFVASEAENKESTINYPRPHWEKNGKPSFLLNTSPNKNDLNRLPPPPPPPPPQIAPTLIPPSSPPQRYRRPIPPMMAPIRKNFNEASTNIKPKPNLPNILPQFRPNTKIGSGPYHRPPPGFIPNRRNGVNRYHDKEHGNFPYHIQYPDKEGPPHRDYEMGGQEIVPKFITNRGKLPSELWTNHGVQKRFGQTPQNFHGKFEFSHNPPQGPKVLRRLQRTPVTTLQMLKHTPGVKTQKTQVTREEDDNNYYDHSSSSFLPPFYNTYNEQKKDEENIYIVYPAKPPQKIIPDNSKIFIVEDSKKNQEKFFNFTKVEEQKPLLNPMKKGNDEISQPSDREKTKESEVKVKTVSNDKAEEEMETESEILVDKSHKVNERIDMNLHLQSNNQWNELRSPTNSHKNHYRYSSNKESNEKTEENESLQLNPPSEYSTSIADDKDSAFTLGAVMHTMSDGGQRKGQVSNVPLHKNDKKQIKLNVNERISNGKIITVSMPLDVKKERDDDNDDDNKLNKSGFDAPFQASSSVNSNNTYTNNQGWTVVRGTTDEKIEPETENITTQPSTTKFNFDNFKPELIGGFKPLFELPAQQQQQHEEIKKTVVDKMTTENDKKTSITR